MLVSENGYRVSYYCKIGYTLYGLSSRQCQTNGTGWNGQDPSCGNRSILTLCFKIMLMVNNKTLTAMQDIAGTQLSIIT